jgi:hypothetical protein
MVWGMICSENRSPAFRIMFFKNCLAEADTNTPKPGFSRRFRVGCRNRGDARFFPATAVP